MATYEYRCPRDGSFDVRSPIGTAAPAVPCPACGDEARRVISAPALARTPRPLAAALDRAARSAEAPEVVSAPPPRRAASPARPARPVNPGHARLPRPTRS
ncbi:FmdB family zinc ribbon protein [Planosporangium sp. 12N6]|uniref:FmdB family zinc ribbon protein n=1 Tax=Planosporangium spinosum TaxID=3402278 RepID=UPI003CF98684